MKIRKKIQDIQDSFTHFWESQIFFSNSAVLELQEIFENLSFFAKNTIKLRKTSVRNFSTNESGARASLLELAMDKNSGKCFY